MKNYDEEKLATLGLFLQIGVAAGVFFSLFSGIGDTAFWKTPPPFLQRTLPAGVPALVIRILSFGESLPFLLQLALPVGGPALSIGIISLIFRKGSGSVVGICLIILINIVVAIYMTASEGENAGTGILIFFMFFVFAIPGFIMAVMEVKLADEAFEKNWLIILSSGIIAVLLFIFLPKTIPIDGFSQPDVPVNIGTWKFSGQGIKPWTGDLYIETCQDNTFSGRFYWREEGKKNNRSRGTEYFEGNYNEQTQQVFMKGTRLSSDARGLVLGEYQARVADDGRTLTNGTWGGDSTWEATWVKKLRK